MRLDEIIGYHGTKADFDQYDPALTGDIGIHFGSREQADSAARHARKPGYPDGANIRRADLDVHNLLRVQDRFSTLRQTFVGRAKQWSLETRGFRLTPEEHDELYHWAKIADKARRKGGGDWSIQLDKNKAKELAIYQDAGKRFWAVIQASAIRQGYDGFVYANRVEGKGDSYVVFDPTKIKTKWD